MDTTGRPKSFYLDRLVGEAKKRGGKLVSTVYVTARTNMEWKCKEGHTWFATPDNFLRGTWCKECAGMTKHTIEEMNVIAEEKGGKCLSKIYHDGKSKLKWKWKCKCGYKWKAVPITVIKGHWCPKCAGNMPSNIGEMKKLAKKKGGRCYSTRYENESSRLKWECKYGHKWVSEAANIKAGKWCPECGGTAKSNIKKMNQLAQERGGQCLSKKYVNDWTSLRWACSKNHKWAATPSNIKRNKWCPDCAHDQRGAGERFCRAFFEKAFGTKFSRAYPSWLRGATGAQLELDGYSGKLKLAFEHHGKQHFRRTEFFHVSEEDFVKRKGIDRLKENLCHDRGVTLIVIPQVNEHLKPEDVWTYIHDATSTPLWGEIVGIGCSRGF